MPYIADPTNPTQPTEDISLETAAAEFRALKAYIRDDLLQGVIDAEAAAAASAVAAEASALAAGVSEDAAATSEDEALIDASNAELARIAAEAALAGALAAQAAIANLFEFRGAWVTGTAYSAGTPGNLLDPREYVIGPDLATYVIMTNHVSGVFLTDVAAGRLANTDSIQLRSDLATAAALKGANMVAATGAYATVQAFINAIVGASGSVAVMFQQVGVSAAVRTVQSKLADTIHVNDFGADGVGDDGPWFQAALNEAAARGGRPVFFSGNHQILTNVTIPPKCSLIGPHLRPGQQQDGGVGGDYDTGSGVLKVLSSRTISISSSASLEGAILIRDGLNLPFANLAAAQAGVPLFAGTPITLIGEDAGVEDVLLLGFATGISSTNRSRMRIINVQGDCTNGIYITNCKDVAYIAHCHFWPFTTANFSWTASDATQLILTRTGVAYNFENVVDYSRIHHCFDYGYFRGFRLSSVAGNLVQGCSSDGPVNAGVPAHAGSIGFLIDGGATTMDNQLHGCYSAGKAHGFYAAALAGTTNSITDCNATACSEGLTGISGTIHWHGGVYRNCNYGYTATASVVLRGGRQMFQDSLTASWNYTGANNSCVLTDISFANVSAGAAVAPNNNWTIPALASADPLNLPPTGDYYLVTGSVGFGTVHRGWKDREVTLLFNAACNVLNGGNMRLDNSATFAAVNGSTLTLKHNGVVWYEKSRSR